MEAVSIKDLTFTYPEADRPALEGISLSLDEGKILCVLGPTGCGKTTLLKNLKPIVRPHGEIRGSVELFGCEVGELSQREQAADIGYVIQNPDNQIVTDKVWHELAFGLENLGTEPRVIRRKVAEIAGFFGIESWYENMTSELSGGQKQLLNLAAAMVSSPKLLLLDEPTAQLDPVAAADFLAAVRRVNLELGTTIILTEHRTDEVVSLADKICVMKDDRVAAYGSAGDIAGMAVQGEMLSDKVSLLDIMPQPLQAYAAYENGAAEEELPLDVPSGRRWLSGIIGAGELAEQEPKILPEDAEAKENAAANKLAVEIKKAWYRYDKNRSDVLKGVNLKVGRGEVFAILGGNGAGKSTLLNLLCGNAKAYRGKVNINGNIAMLPQDPQTLFLHDTVKEELGAPTEGNDDNTTRDIFEIGDLAERHPYDLSGGEQQRLALEIVFSADADIYLLDEPTKGLDPYYRKKLAEQIRKLKGEGKTLIIVSHDMTFCARVADRCAMLFRGEIVSDDAARKFFAENMYYTTPVGRMSRGLIEGALLPEDITLAFSCTKTGE